MTPLEREIRTLIAVEGPIPVSRYMALCLGHPTHGYYMTRDPIGMAGDFVTAPEISQMFGELVGLWAAQTWIDLGRPSPFALVELGPGRGTLMADALRAAKVAPGFLQAAAVHLVETSPVLRARQRATLASPPAALGGGVHWHASLDDVPDRPVIALANEFFDALPIRQVVRDRGAWRERLVGIDAGGALAFGLAPDADPSVSYDAPDGAVLEIAAAGAAVMRALAARIVACGGAALAIDYGHARTGFADTLQAVRRHAFADPLVDAGEADVTAHVDFAQLAQAAQDAGARVFGPVTQGALLRALGIEHRARTLASRASAKASEEIGAALTRLAGEGEDDMGVLFKALAVAHPRLSACAGFA
ncbi:class I SAM-dependent methyltransferase [Salinarimonas ramus]|uniref:ATP synthase subunit beta n=1 Tax=Salinarimonas ramus TaxID=690164 RepID=A0A917Q5C1_9HYPH|nr:SAM-dependent methyltransferase [Salinarimonas ramus]GGK25044.1 ATP synthase subunit beta [Salinarimonas ramus]